MKKIVLLLPMIFFLKGAVPAQAEALPDYMEQASCLGAFEAATRGMESLPDKTPDTQAYAQRIEEGYTKLLFAHGSRTDETAARKKEARQRTASDYARLINRIAQASEGSEKDAAFGALFDRVDFCLEFTNKQ